MIAPAEPNCEAKKGLLSLRTNRFDLIGTDWHHRQTSVRRAIPTELVAIDDALTTILWTLYFIEAQGYSIK